MSVLLTLRHAFCRLFVEYVDKRNIYAQVMLRLLTLPLPVTCMAKGMQGFRASEG